MRALRALLACALLASCNDDKPNVDPDASKPPLERGNPAADSALESGAADERIMDGAISNPGKVACGATECVLGGQALCCLRPAGTPSTCTTNPQCQEPTDLRLACDEAADCPQGGGVRLCCLAFTGTNRNADCLLADPAGGCGSRVQLCKSAADCSGGSSCSIRRCGGYDVRVCGNPAGCV